MHISARLLALLLLPAISFGQLTPKQIHDQAIVVDTHNDVLTTVTLNGMSIETDLTGRAHTDLARLKKGGVDLQVFSIFCDGSFGKGTAYNLAIQEIDSLYAIAKRNPSKIEIVYSSTQALAAIKKGKIAAMCGVEGGHMMEDDLDHLDSFYKRGVRYMTLTWNNSTGWATSAWDETKHAFSASPYGLTDYGRAVVKRMNDLGIIVDISHVGEKTFYDALAATTKPVIASHSSVWTICPVPRNLKDDQIKAVAKNGGVIQVNFYPGFLDSNYQKRFNTFNQSHKNELDSLTALKQPEYKIQEYFAKKYPGELKSLRPPLSVLIDHIDYIAKLVGVDYVGLGSDFDGIEMAPQELEGVQDYPKITMALIKRGYKKNEIDKILGGNFIRVLKANEK